MKETDEKPSHLLETETDELEAEADERRPHRRRKRSMLLCFLRGGPRAFGGGDSGAVRLLPCAGCSGLPIG